MKIPPMIAVACSLVLVSCSNLGSTGSSSKADGIHARSSFRVPSDFVNARSSNGFHPAAVSLSATERSRNFSKDKHGMATYPLKVRERVVRTTAYSHQENEVGAPWKKNALGTYLKYGNVRSAAADWSRYPVGTRFKIKGLPYTYQVDDYGSALVGTNTIDIYHPNLSTMRRWGTRKAEIVVTQWGSWSKTLKILKGRTKYRHTRKMYYAAKAKVDSGKARLD